MIENNNLPKHWQTVISADILDIRDGTHDTPKYVNENGIPLITSKNLKKSKIDFEKISFISKEDHQEISKRSKVQKGDILFAMIGTIGNPAIIKGDSNFSIKNVGLFKKNKGVILPEYLVNFLGSTIFEKQLSDRKLLKGTTQKFIPLGNLRKIEIPLPPLLEQQAIVAKIDELLSELENGKEQLITAQQQLKVYRQSLLKWAFEGKLTNKNLKDGELPKGWELSSIGEICDMKAGFFVKADNIDKEYKEGLFPCYGGNGLRGYTNSFTHKGKYSLVGRQGALCGNVHRVNGVFHATEHAVVTSPKDGINTDWLFYKLTAMKLNQYSAGAAQPGLSVNKLFKIKVCYPPLYEQELIVSELESKLTVCDKIEETISQSLQQAETLRQSILKKAFEGKLV